MADIKIAYHTSAWGRDGFPKCLEDLDALGFRYIEMPGDVAAHYYDKLYEFKTLLAGHGLKLAAMRGGGELINPETRDKELAYNKMICEFLRSNGGQTLVISGGARPPASPVDDDFKRLADFCNEIGRFCEYLRIKACIHTATGGVVQTRADVDRIMELTDPALVCLCPDTGHLAKAGADPVEITRAYADRVGHIYFTDADMLTPSPLSPPCEDSSVPPPSEAVREDMQAEPAPGEKRAAEAAPPCGDSSVPPPSEAVREDMQAEPAPGEKRAAEAAPPCGASSVPLPSEAVREGVQTEPVPGGERTTEGGIIEILRNANYSGCVTLEPAQTHLTPRESAAMGKQYVESMLAIPVAPHPVPSADEAPPPPVQQEETPPRQPEQPPRKEQTLLKQDAETRPPAQER